MRTRLRSFELRRGKLRTEHKESRGMLWIVNITNFFLFVPFVLFVVKTNTMLRLLLPARHRC
jgi:hypothetical protein